MCIYPNVQSTFLLSPLLFSISPRAPLWVNHSLFSLSPSLSLSRARACASFADTTNLNFLFQKCDTAAGDKGVESSAVLKTAAPDVYNEEAFFAPRSKAQEDANVGTTTADEQARTGNKPPFPAGPWLEAAKELVPPPPPPEVKRHAPVHGGALVQCIAGRQSCHARK